MSIATVHEFSCDGVHFLVFGDEDENCHRRGLRIVNASRRNALREA